MELWGEVIDICWNSTTFLLVQLTFKMWNLRYLVQIYWTHFIVYEYWNWIFGIFLFEYHWFKKHYSGFLDQKFRQKRVLFWLISLVWTVYVLNATIRFSNCNLCSCVNCFLDVSVSYLKPFGLHILGCCWDLASP